MRTFLEYVADDLYSHHGKDLSRVAIVFPNKRASLFFREHIAMAADGPLWSPTYISIRELFERHTEQCIGDSIRLVCLLHKCFNKCTGSNEPIDRFYSWGEVLLSDFDDIDKAMADAKKVFSNVRDLHELDDISHLTEEQRTALESFFGCFKDESALKGKFLNLWTKLYDIYRMFNDTLDGGNVTYEGALYRKAVNGADEWNDFDEYAFVGFNVLNKVEERLFDALKTAGKARFYWDYDIYYKDIEAGRHISKYLDRYPNSLKGKDIYNNFQNDKEIVCISSSTENMQARYVATWLKEANRIADGRRTAVVLCDETLLLPVIHSIPDEVTDVNITTGYPLTQAPISSLVQQLFTLFTIGRNRNSGRFSKRWIMTIQNHPYMDEREDLISKLTVEQDITPQNILLLIRDVVETIAHDNINAEDPLTVESLFRMYTLLNRIADLMQTGILDADTPTLQRLVLQAIRSTSIPFHGEPAVGVQVMGMLETRNLDFDHVLILSANEGNIPKGTTDVSFIPYNVRKAYDLTTTDHKTDIYAYYFYRLLQRAKDITVLYSTSTQGVGAKELCRYMQQIIVESGHDVSRKALRAGSLPMSTNALEVVKGSNVMARLRQITDLSPTVINRYIRCQKQFYYYKVEGLEEYDDNDEDIIDNRIFGNIFHEAAQRIYDGMVDDTSPIEAARPMEKERLADISMDPTKIERIVDETFKAQEVKDDSGLAQIIKQVIVTYLKRLIDLDLEQPQIILRALEKEFMMKWKVVSKREQSQMHLSYAEREQARPEVKVVSKREQSQMHLSYAEREQARPEVKVEAAEESFYIDVGGIVDRLDIVTDENGKITVRVIDYKTGKGLKRVPASVEALFNPSTEHGDYYLQAFLYSVIISHELNGEIPVAPALLFIQKAVSNPNPILKLNGNDVTDIAAYAEEFSARLSQVINEIFNPDIPFTPTTDRKTCERCPYHLLCRV